ncbi:MAG: 2-oxoacid:acceptor oxidoreductase subunit alpha, partial [Candidatus Zixiibacteriota bacterium]
MSDLDIGMNDWVVPELQWDDGYQPDRGRVLSPEELEKIKSFHRYSNWDENFVTSRTLPGFSEKGAYLARGSGHNRLGNYTELPEEYQDVLDRLLEKHKASAKFIPPPIIEKKKKAKLSLVTLGGCDAAVREALDILSARKIEADYMRIRGFPFDGAVEKFLNDHEVNYIVEQNRDHQLKSLIAVETSVPKQKLKSILHYGGFPLSARQVVDGLLHALEKLDGKIVHELLPDGLPKALSGAEG